MQRAGLRLDDKTSALKGSARGAVIVPGDSTASKLYQMVAAKKMPLDDGLSVLEVEDLKAWIDGGAKWPEPRVIPGMVVDPRVDGFRLSLRNADRPAVAKAIADPTLIKARGKDGSTPLHHAAVYGDAALVKALLDKGADVNAVNLDGITPLIWGIHDDAIAALLIDRGADVNAASDSGVTPLQAAAGRANGSVTVQRLLDKGARVPPPLQPLVANAAGIAADLATIKILFPKVIPANGPGAGVGVTFMTVGKCYACLDYMIAQGSRGPTLGGALVAAANSGDAALVKRLLDLGATTDGRGPQDATALIAAAASDQEAAEKVRLLLAAGADVNVPDAHGRTPLTYARTLHPDIVPTLLAKGAK